MLNRSSKRHKRPANTNQLARVIVDEATGDTLFEQPLVDGGKPPATIALEQPVGLKGGKARAKKLGKAKLTAIAERIKRSRRKR